MSVNVNLLRERQMQAIERQRDPFKIALLAVLTLALILVGYYMLKANQARIMRNELTRLKNDWSKTEPQMLAAEQRSAELERILAEAQGLKSLMTDRFYWSRFLAVVTNNLPGNATFTSLSGNAGKEDRFSCEVSGVIASESPRQAADALRLALQKVLEKEYSSGGIPYRVEVKLPLVEDESDTYDVGGRTLPSASFNLEINFVVIDPDNPKE